MIESQFPHWDFGSFILFMAMGFFFVFCMYYLKISSNRHTKRIDVRRIFVLYSFIFLWTSFAVFRLVTPFGIGGYDAYPYIEYFENCLNEDYLSTYVIHLDPLFQWINKAIRFFTGDYHIYFAILYGTIVVSYYLFIREFTPLSTNWVPYILVVAFYILGFNSLRSTYGIAILFLAFILVYRKKYFWAIIIALSTIFIHKACFIYVMAIPFYLFFRNRSFTIYHAIGFFIFSLLIGATLQAFFIRFTFQVDLQGAYGSYAQRSYGTSFFDNTWRIAIEQLLLAVCLFAGNNRIVKHIRHNPKMKMIWMICMFDIILIPVNYLIGNWRSHEFLFLFRVVMWGEVLYVFFMNFEKSMRYIFSIACLILYIARMYLQLSKVSSMPYILDI